jgi:selenocysteine lyase/cysteine desulfurase
MYRDDAMASTRSKSAAQATIDRWRADTPGCTERVHLNNAGAALVPSSVATAVAGHLALESTLAAMRRPRAWPTSSRTSMQAWQHCSGRATERGRSSQLYRRVLAGSFHFRPRPRQPILTTGNDYASNQIMYLSLAQRCGVEVVRADDLAEGGVDPQSMRELIRRRRPSLVAVTWVPTNSGLVQRWKRWARSARKRPSPISWTVAR